MVQGQQLSISRACTKQLHESRERAVRILHQQFPLPLPQMAAANVVPGLSEVPKQRPPGCDDAVTEEDHIRHLDLEVQAPTTRHVEPCGLLGTWMIRFDHDLCPATGEVRKSRVLPFEADGESSVLDVEGATRVDVAHEEFWNEWTPLHTSPSLRRPRLTITHHSR